MSLPTLWGHGPGSRRGWHPSMSPYLVGLRDGLAVAGTSQYQRALLRAARVYRDILTQGGQVWVVNTRRDLAPLVTHLCAHFPHIGYSARRWTPGTLTNWPSVCRSLLSYGVFQHRCGQLLERERLSFPRYHRYRSMYCGLVSETGTPRTRPDLLILVNPGDMPRVVEEARAMHIPTVGCMDTDASTGNITYPIPVAMGHSHQVYTTLALLLSSAPRK